MQKVQLATTQNVGLRINLSTMRARLTAERVQKILDLNPVVLCLSFDPIGPSSLETPAEAVQYSRFTYQGTHVLSPDCVQGRHTIPEIPFRWDSPGQSLSEGTGSNRRLLHRLGRGIHGEGSQWAWSSS